MDGKFSAVFHNNFAFPILFPVVSLAHTEESWYLCLDASANSRADYIVNI